MATTYAKLDEVKELRDYIADLPTPDMKHRAREVFRSILKLPWSSAAVILNRKYGFDFDYKGANESDWGNSPAEN